jgi:hypothetical protein
MAAFVTLAALNMNVIAKQAVLRDTEIHVQPVQRTGTDRAAHLLQQLTETLCPRHGFVQSRADAH